LKTILPLSDELNDILRRIFESNPEDRITISELKRRIQMCSRFSELQPPSPPASLRQSCQSPASSVSDDGSLPESCATLSDLGSDSDPGYDSMESDEPSSDEEDCFELDTPEFQQPAVPFSQQQIQQYVLPSQDIYGSMPKKAVVSNPFMTHNPWIQSWFATGYPFGQPQVVPQVFYPAPYPHVQYPSPFQPSRDVYVY
jgi:serine/threonine protein kinase